MLAFSENVMPEIGLHTLPFVLLQYKDRSVLNRTNYKHKLSVGLRGARADSTANYQIREIN